MSLACCAASLGTGAGTAIAAVPAFVRTVGQPSVAAMYPSGLEYDAGRSRIVVADTGMNRVLLYGLDGTSLGSFGVMGEADGQFQAPRDAAVDAASNIYIADAENNRVQKFDQNGTWLWSARGVPHPMGVTFDEVNDKLLVAGTGGNIVRQLTPATGATEWTSPRGGALGFGQVRDAARGPDGRIWITDYTNAQIKAYDVSATGTWATTPARVLGARGRGQGLLGFPYNVDFSPDGRIAYVTDTAGAEIERWDISGSTPVSLRPFAGHCPESPLACPDPPADSGYFDELRRVAVTPEGHVVGADFWGNGLQVFRRGGLVQRQIEGFAAPPNGAAQAYGVAVASNGNTYVMDRLNQQIDRYDASGRYLNSAGNRGVAEGTFSWPEGVAVAPDGKVWVADTRNDQLMRWNPDLTAPVSVPQGLSKGSGLGQFNQPAGVDVDQSGQVWVADTWNNRVQVYDPATGQFRAFGRAGSAAGRFNKPQGVAVSADSVYVADTGNNRVQKFRLDGTYVARSSTVAMKAPEGVAVADDGTVYAADTGNNRVLHLAADLVNLRDGLGAGTGLYHPHSLTINGESLFVADTHNHRVLEFDLAP